MKRRWRRGEAKDPCTRTTCRQVTQRESADAAQMCAGHAGHAGGRDSHGSALLLPMCCADV